MTPRDFLYWLQGAFENGLSELSPEIVGRHAELAIQCHGERPLDRMVATTIAVCGAMRFGGQPCWEKIRAQVADVFEHVLDPLVEQESGKTNEELGAIHEQGSAPTKLVPKPPQPVYNPPAWANDKLMRC